VSQGGGTGGEGSLTPFRLPSRVLGEYSRDRRLIIIMYKAITRSLEDFICSKFQGSLLIILKYIILSIIYLYLSVYLPNYLKFYNAFYVGEIYSSFFNLWCFVRLF